MLIKTIFLLSVFNFLSCAMFQTDTEKTEDLLPREIELPGWKIIAGPDVFNSNNIHEYIKAQEELHIFEVSGFQELSIAQYSSLSNPDRAINIEIFRMDSSLNAFGIFSTQRIDGAVNKNACDDSYSAGQNYYARKSNYYIKIKPLNNYAGAGSDIKLFLETVCNKIKNGENLPGYLPIFGDKDDRTTLSYWIEGYPKLTKIKSVFSQKVEIEGKIKTIFFAKRSSEYNSLSEFSGLLNDKNNQFILSSAGEIQIAFSRTSENEYIFISVYKEWIFGIADISALSEGEKAINYMYLKLNSFPIHSR
jgi:hypothetical protein